MKQPKPKIKGEKKNQKRVKSTRAEFWGGALGCLDVGREGIAQSRGVAAADRGGAKKAEQSLTNLVCV